MPDVIVICANGLQPAFLGAYGNPWIHTPNIDRLAASGFVFDWHYPDNLTTLPTRRSWWSGHYTLHDDLKGWGPVESSSELELLTGLAKAGIDTTIISDCPYVNDPSMKYTRPWKHKILVRGSAYDPWCEPSPHDPSPTLEPGLVLPPPDSDEYEIWLERWNDLLRNRQQTNRLNDESQTGSAQVFNSAIQWLNARHATTSPFFLWLDIFCPHGPWDIPEYYRDYYATNRGDEFEIHETGDILLPENAPTKSTRTLIDVPGGWVGDVISEDELDRLRKTYAGAVTMLDTHFGLLLAHLEATDKINSTVIIFVSDQGEPLGEHGFVRRPVANVYEELAHTPLIVKWPDAHENGQRSNALVQSIDLAPTIFNAFSLTPPPAWPGTTLKKLIDHPGSTWRDHAIYAMDDEVYAYRTSDWLLIKHDEPLDADDQNPLSNEPQLELFHKPEDKWDQNDLASQFEDEANSLLQKLQQSLSALRPPDNSPPTSNQIDHLAEGES